MISLTHCDCCGLPIHIPHDEDCPRCGYPINKEKEEAFLRSSLHDLQRVADHGGALITIVQLIQRYRSRLQYLTHLDQVSAEHVQAEQRGEVAIAQPVNPQDMVIAASTVKPAQGVPNAAWLEASTSYQRDSQTLPPSSTTAHRVFSLRSFLADQSINIVASLGAFLILIGSLSFIITTTNLLLSFLVLLIVHAIFGTTGAITFRFRSLRTVSIIYTAIFALQVPLLGFSTYRLASGNHVQLSSATLIAVAALYAALAYCVLAVYQNFKPFGYLAATALLIADLALSEAFHLSYWWYPTMLMILAFPLLFVLCGNSSSLPVRWSVLSEPGRLLMTVIVGLAFVGLAVFFVVSWSANLYWLLFGSDSFSLSAEIHYSFAVLALLTCVWMCLYCWRTKNQYWIQYIPYLCVLWALAILSALYAQTISYILAFIGMALLLHGFYFLLPSLFGLFANLRRHTELLSLLLVGFIPFLALPFPLPELFIQTYMPWAFFAMPVNEMWVSLIALLVGMVLIGNIMLSHTGWHKLPVTDKSAWRWLLLLAGFILNCAYSEIILWHAWPPVWNILGLALFILLMAVLVRHFISAQWARPIEVVVLGAIVETLLLSGTLSASAHLFLLLGLAIVTYSVLLYQRRNRLIFFPFVFVVLSLPFIFYEMPILLTISAVLPLLAAGLHRFISSSRIYGQIVRKNGVPLLTLSWTWPVFGAALLYGVSFAFYDSVSLASTAQSHFGIPITATVELALLALVWYAAAVIAQRKRLLVPALGLGIVALISPANQFVILTWIAPALFIVALVVSRLAGRDWALPIYIAAGCACIMTGLTGYTQDQLAHASWVLLALAGLVYLAGVGEKDKRMTTGLLWGAAGVACWSTFDAGLLGDLYRPPVVALTCAVVGMRIGSLRYASLHITRQRLLFYALPVYVVSLFSGILTGIYGTLQGVNIPFYGAIPIALLVYAAVAYAVSVFERYTRWLWITVIFGLWGTVLIPQIGSCSYSLPGHCLQSPSVVLYGLTGVAIGGTFLALIIGRLTRWIRQSHGAAVLRWSWPWYLIALWSMLVTAAWSEMLFDTTLIISVRAVLCVFIVLALVVMFMERIPEIIVLALGLAVWIIAHANWLFWKQMLAYSLLSLCCFGSQFFWSVIDTERVFFLSPRFAALLGLGGQCLVVVLIMLGGGLLPADPLLAHVGSFTLVALALLLVWEGRIQAAYALRRGYQYGAGLLLSLVVSWELVAFDHAQLSVLWLAPATYLVLLATFIARDERLPKRQHLAQFCSLLGSALLLLPLLWLSFAQADLVSTLLLMAEALLLFLLGVLTRIRIFVLCGVGIVIVCAIHVLFLPSLGIPTFLALSLVGILLLAIATALVLIRSRVTSLWSGLE